MAFTNSRIDSNLHVAGTLSATTFAAPDGCITDDAILAGADIAWTKTQHKHCVRYSQKVGTAVVAETMLVHIAHAAGDVINVQVACNVAPTSTDTVTVDVKAGNTSTAFASILTGVVTLNNASTARTVYEGTISSASYSADDVVEVVVAVSGSSCQGLVVTINFAEAAQ